MRLALLGLGLIGGSIARAVRPAGWAVAAWTPTGAGPARALEEGAIDRAADTVADAVAGADLVPHLLARAAGGQRDTGSPP